MVPLQDPYSEALLIQAKRKRTVLRRWWNREQAPFGRCLRSTGSPFQVVGPTTENERVCIVTEQANGTTKLPRAEGRSVRQPAHEERDDFTVDQCYQCLKSYKTKIIMIRFDTMLQQSTEDDLVNDHLHRGMEGVVLIGRFDAFCPTGRGFQSRSRHHDGTLGKSLTCSCLWRFGVKLRHSVPALFETP